MRVAVCCPGPSLPRRWPGRAGYDLVYAVNRALIAVPEADWLSAGDLPLFNGLLPPGCRPRHGVVTMDDTAAEVRSRPDWATLWFVGWRALPIIAEHHRRGRPLAWSVQAALCHAAESDALHVDLYGCDGAAGGTAIDCTGYRGEDRSADRWAREELDLAMTAELLGERGITLSRISP